VEPVQKKSGEDHSPPFAKNIESEAYFFGASSFLGLHFSQVFLFFAASTQHLWLHSLPAFLASSQQPACRFAVPRVSAKAQTIKLINLMLFILPFVVCVITGQLITFISPTLLAPGTKLGYLWPP
jgi:hypothetical protein